MLQGLRKETIDRIDKYLNAGEDENSSSNSSNSKDSKEKDSKNASSSSSSSSKKFSFKSFMTQGPRIPKKSMEDLQAPPNITRNFPPAISQECHLFHYLSRFKVDWAIQKAFQTMALARPLPRLAQFKAAFLRGYLIEYMKPTLLEPVLLTPNRTAFLKELV